MAQHALGPTSTTEELQASLDALRPIVARDEGRGRRHEFVELLFHYHTDLLDLPPDARADSVGPIRDELLGWARRLVADDAPDNNDAVYMLSIALVAAANGVAEEGKRNEDKVLPMYDEAIGLAQGLLDKRAEWANDCLPRALLAAASFCYVGDRLEQALGYLERVFAMRDELFTLHDLHDACMKKAFVYDKMGNVLEAALAGLECVAVSRSIEDRDESDEMLLQGLGVVRMVLHGKDQFRGDAVAAEKEAIDLLQNRLVPRNPSLQDQLTQWKKYYKDDMAALIQRLRRSPPQPSPAKKPVTHEAAQQVVYALWQLVASNDVRILPLLAGYLESTTSVSVVPPLLAHFRSLFAMLDEQDSSVQLCVSLSKIAVLLEDWTGDIREPLAIHLKTLALVQSLGPVSGSPDSSEPAGVVRNAVEFLGRNS